MNISPESQTSYSKSVLSTSSSLSKDSYIPNNQLQKISCFDALICQEDRIPIINQQLLDLIEKKQFIEFFQEIEQNQDSFKEIEPFIFRKFVECHFIELQRIKNKQNGQQLSQEEYNKFQEFSCLSFNLMEFLISQNYSFFDEKFLQIYIRQEPNECNIDSFYRQFVLKFQPGESEKEDQIKMRIFCFYSYIQSLLYYKSDKKTLQVFTEFSQKNKILQKLGSGFQQLQKDSYEMIYKMLKKCLLAKQFSTNTPQLLNIISNFSQIPDITYFNKLITYFSKIQQVENAQQVLDFIIKNKIEPTIASFNTIIDSYFKLQQSDNALEIYDILIKQFCQIQPDNFTISTLINGLKSDNQNIQKLSQILENFSKQNKHDQIMVNTIIDICVTQQNSLKFQKILDTFISQCKLDLISYNTLIKGCCKSINLDKAEKYFDQMKFKQIYPNNITFNSLLDCCIKSQNTQKLWNYYDQMVNVYKITPDNYTYSIIMNGIKSKQNSQDSKQQFNKFISIIFQSDDHAKNIDLILYNTLIDACIKFQDYNKIFEIFAQIQLSGLQPNNITYGLLIKALGTMKNLDQAFKIFTQMKEKYDINDITYGCLLDACIKNNRIDMALVIMNQMKEEKIQLNTVHYTTLIKGLGQSKKYQDAFTIFELMKQDSNSKPNIITFNSILDVAVQAQDDKKIEQIMNEVNLLQMGDLITYSTLTKYYGRKGDINQIILVVDEMVKAKIQIDDRLMNYILETCFKHRKSLDGVKMCQKLDKYNLTNFRQIQVYSTLMKMYGMTRYFKSAQQLFQKMEDQSQIQLEIQFYSNYIQACINTKQFQEALKLNQQLSSSKNQIQRDSVFFMKMVTGCLNLNNLKEAINISIQSINLNKIMLPELYQKVVDAAQKSQNFDKQNIEIIKNHIQISQQNDENDLNADNGGENNAILRENTQIYNKAQFKQQNTTKYTIKNGFQPKVQNTYQKSTNQENKQNRQIINNNNSNKFVRML